MADQGKPGPEKKPNLVVIIVTENTGDNPIGTAHKMLGELMAGAPAAPASPPKSCEGTTQLPSETIADINEELRADTPDLIKEREESKPDPKPSPILDESQKGAAKEVGKEAGSAIWGWIVDLLHYLGVG